MCLLLLNCIFQLLILISFFLYIYNTFYNQYVEIKNILINVLYKLIEGQLLIARRQSEIL